MKTKYISVIVLTLILITGTAFCVESQSDANRPVIGIALDTIPLPSLLTKHLGLKSGQGIRIGNIMKGSSAAEEGLDIDDIVIALQGKDLFDRETLTNTVRQLGAGAEVSMEIIHLGQRKTVNLKLKPLSETTGWKYTNEPQIEQVFKPGRVFRFGPDDQSWTQIIDSNIPDNMRPNMDTLLNELFKELYSSYYNINGKQYHVIIEGNPDNKDSKITVKIDKDKHETTIGELDKLPKEYQEAAKNAIENAKQKETNRIPMFFDDSGDSLTPGMDPDFPLMNTPNLSGNPYFQRMEEQMRLMREQFRELEQSHQNLLDHLKQEKP